MSIAKPKSRSTTEEQMSNAREIAGELDEIFSARIYCKFEWSKKDPMWLMSRQFDIFVREKLHELMDACGIEL